MHNDYRDKGLWASEQGLSLSVLNINIIWSYARVVSGKGLRPQRCDRAPFPRTAGKGWKFGPGW